ncbi:MULTISPECIES: DUF2760 domain-containing protein [unclassified Neochlamydia]|uniref:DUF2760 domain-containing protein n=1 Tax=unclassified Neochlamydia TaxID=2643326 RepID=UPI00140B3355|nr:MULTISPECIES: DUF2760 domain-containing protein [unclassified Neochlamydia]MBS4166614.1 Uncharacterized protein [Neochlamydia sp. AcF65]MBS4171357.1 Uncharacterized protein [Neochlamydia sp. AcF95]NGY94771.1 hypothetical protein [Neochlamydia sp. AcF84]
MNFLLAIKAFIKAWKEPTKALAFLDDSVKNLESPKQDYSHLRLLALLQQSGRLIDFLKEDIHAFTDAQVGAAVRQIHQECSKNLEELVTIRPIMLEKEGAMITVPKGYDTAAIKVSGQVRGEPPYIGTIVHQGWKAHKRSLPMKMAEQASEIICPAEIEVKG